MKGKLAVSQFSRGLRAIFLLIYWSLPVKGFFKTQAPSITSRSNNFWCFRIGFCLTIKMFGQIDHTAEIATCAYFFSFQRTDKVNINYFSSFKKRRISFPQEITRTSQSYSRQNQSVCPACCAFLSRRAWLPWHAQKMCAVTIVGTVLKYKKGKNLQDQAKKFSKGQRHQSQLQTDICPTGVPLSLDKPEMSSDLL